MRVHDLVSHVQDGVAHLVRRQEESSSAVGDQRRVRIGEGNSARMDVPFEGITSASHPPRVRQELCGFFEFFGRDVGECPEDPDEIPDCAAIDIDVDLPGRVPLVDLDGLPERLTEPVEEVRELFFVAAERDDVSSIRDCGRLGERARHARIDPGAQPDRRSLAGRREQDGRERRGQQDALADGEGPGCHGRGEHAEALAGERAEVQRIRAIGQTFHLAVDGQVVGQECCSDVPVAGDRVRRQEVSGHPEEARARFPPERDRRLSIDGGGRDRLGADRAERDVAILGPAPEPGEEPDCGEAVGIAWRGLPRRRCALQRSRDGRDVQRLNGAVHCQLLGEVVRGPWERSRTAKRELSVPEMAMEECYFDADA